MSPRATLALSLAALAAALAFERAQRLRSTPDEATAVERLVPEGALAGRTVAAVSVERDGSELLYLRTRGLWRSREAYGAVCDPERIEALLATLLEARGVEVCAGPACGASLGFDSPGALRVLVRGPGALREPDGDPLLALEYAAGPGTLARRATEPRVLEIDRDPRPLLARDRALPPFVDRRVLAGSLPAPFRGFERLALEMRATRFELAPPAGAAEGENAWELAQDGARGAALAPREAALASREAALAWRVGGWISLWIRLTWDEVADPRIAAGLGADPPRARVTLTPRGGAPIELWISEPDAANRVHVWNRTTNVLASVRAELFPLLAPQPADFTREGANPWESWLAPR